MRFASRPLAPISLTLLLTIVLAEPAWTGALRVVSSDDRGVTLVLEVPSFSIAGPGADGRSKLAAPGLDVVGIPGRPQLPFAAALIALPPEARPVVRVEAGDPEETREGVRLRISPQPGLRNDGGALGVVPTMEAVPPVLDGPWPRSPVELDEPFTVRRQRVVDVRLYPFRYDEASGRLWSRKRLTVRIEFGAGAVAAPAAAPEEDRYWEPVLKGVVLNYGQGRSWRETGGRGVAPEGAIPALPRPGARGVPGAEGAAAFDDEPEVRVQIDTTGVYALPYDQLSLHGYPPAVPIDEVSVHRHEYVQDAPPPAPPYETPELAIEVVDHNLIGTFDSGDTILVFVQSWAERSRASIAQREWGDAEVIYVTRVTGRIGRRFDPKPAFLGFSLAPLTSYPWTQRWERNIIYVPAFVPGASDTNTDLFHWTEDESYAFPDSFRFETNDLEPADSVSFTVSWQGRRADNHINWAQIRNGSNQFTMVVDSLFWGGQSAAAGRRSLTRTARLAGSALTNGNTNVLRVWGKTNPLDNPATAVVRTGFNWFQATYGRRFRVLRGYLSCNSGGAVGDFQVEASGFTGSGIRVYDVTDSLNPARLTIPDSLIVLRSVRNYAVRFQDTSPSGAARRYVAFTTAKTVPASRYSAVTPRHLTERSSGDYLLIVPEAFMGAVDPLVTLRTSQGLDVVVAPLEAVNDEFNGGRHSSYAIKRFIRYAYRNWNTRFVLLVGDGTDDPQNFLGTGGTDWIPVQKILGPVGVSDTYSNVYEAVPSDPWYVWCVDCPNPVTQLKIHDLFIGRLPANSSQEAADMVSKIVAYENVTPDQAWRHDMLLVADDKYSTLSTFGGGPTGGITYCSRFYEDVFLEITQLAQSVILDTAGLTQSNAEIFDLGEYLKNEPADPDDPSCRESWSGTQQRTHLAVTPKMIEKLNAGRVWWNFQGHANQQVLTHEDLYVNRGSEDDKDLLMNDGKLFLFSGFSCHPNGFAGVNEADESRGPSLGEDMVKLPNRGAVASWASVGFEVLPIVADGHLNVHFARALFADSLRDPRLSDRGTRVVLGQAIATTLLKNLGTAFSGLERDVGITYTLLGDPATRISIGSPQITATANGVPVTDGIPVRLHTPGDSVRLEADLASNVQITDIVLERTDAGGTVTIPAAEYTLTPAFPDTTVPGMGGRRYHLSYATVLTPDSYRYTIRSQDRYGLTSRLEVVFQFQSVLRADGVPLNPGDPVGPNARIELSILSPSPIDPQNDLTLTINGSVPETFTSSPAPGDTSGREWILNWPHPALPVASYQLDLSVRGGASVSHPFRVEVGANELEIRNAIAFPNPFADEGTHFSFSLVSGSPVDILIRVFTVGGHLVYERSARGLPPGYQQIHWDGLDAERQQLANGLYLFRLIARNANTSALHEGRLVKLRKPRRREIETP